MGFIVGSGRDLSFENIQISGTILNSNSSSTAIEVGSVIGYLRGTTSFENITFNGSISGHNFREVGGIVGYLDSQAQMNQLFFNGTISGNRIIEVGGLVGGASGQSELARVTISNSSSMGTVLCTIDNNINIDV